MAISSSSDSSKSSSSSISAPSAPKAPEAPKAPASPKSEAAEPRDSVGLSPEALEEVESKPSIAEIQAEIHQDQERSFDRMLSQIFGPGDPPKGAAKTEPDAPPPEVAPQQPVVYSEATQAICREAMEARGEERGGPLREKCTFERMLDEIGLKP